MMNAAVSDSKVLVNFLNANGEKAGAPLEIPLDTTTSQLQVNIIHIFTYESTTQVPVLLSQGYKTRPTPHLLCDESHAFDWTGPVDDL